MTNVNSQGLFFILFFIIVNTHVWVSVWNPNFWAVHSPINHIFNFNIISTVLCFSGKSFKIVGTTVKYLFFNSSTLSILCMDGSYSSPNFCLPNLSISYLNFSKYNPVVLNSCVFPLTPVEPPNSFTHFLRKSSLLSSLYPPWQICLLSILVKITKGLGTK